MATNGRCCQCIPEANVVEISNELSSRVGEGERVAPEEPLERGDSSSHHREPYQGERGFPSRESRVEEACSNVSLETEPSGRAVGGYTQRRES